ncbi:hypothetical protein BT69DRAFT_1349412 [Atractiella rhizophila]|nr:hypothetical protein BT69DRAFT_1349412 [Atractiella rhizophila]
MFQRGAVLQVLISISGTEAFTVRTPVQQQPKQSPNPSTPTNGSTTSILTIAMSDRFPENIDMVEAYPCDDGTESIAQFHLITAGTVRHGSPLHLSILPSFLPRLPPSIHTLRITFVLPIRFWKRKYGPSKSSYFSLASLENEVEPDGTVILCVALEEESIAVTFGDLVSVDMDDLDEPPFTCTFHLPDNRSEVLFEPVALYSKEQHRFIPLSEWEKSTIPSTGLGTTIQLSLSTTRPTGISPCSIMHLPPEILSLIFEFLSFHHYEEVIQSPAYAYLVDFERLSAVCQLWKAVSVPFLKDFDLSIKERLARLKQYPHAGRLWRFLKFTELDEDISGEMVKDVIAGSPNVTKVYLDAIWNEEEAKIVLHAIESLTTLDDVMFGGQGWRKWKKDEVENFVRRMGGRIKIFGACNVVDSASSTSPGLQLSTDLKELELRTYLPLPLLSLPLTLTWLNLYNLCPLPPSISGSCLPPLLEYLKIKLAPYLLAGKTSTLPTPLDFSHLKHLTWLELDGGEETSNLVSPQFFHTLRNAKAIATIDVRYCVVDWAFTGFVFSAFICWFFGDRGLKEEGDTVDGAEKVKTTRRRNLRVQLFFGGWLEEAIRYGFGRVERSGAEDPHISHLCSREDTRERIRGGIHSGQCHPSIPPRYSMYRTFQSSPPLYSTPPTQRLRGIFKPIHTRSFHTQR